MLLQLLDDNRIALPYRLTQERGRQFTFCSLRLKKSARIVDGAIHRKPISLPNHEVLLSVAGRGVYGSGALVQRNVVSQNTERIAIDERMPKSGVLEFIAGEA